MILVVAGCSAAPNPAGVETAPPVRSTAAHDVTFPLAASPNRRYLVDHRDHPFLIVGDSPQALFVNDSVEQAKHFLVDRKAAGLTGLLITATSIASAAARTSLDRSAVSKKAGTCSRYAARSFLITSSPFSPSR